MLSLLCAVAFTWLVVSVASLVALFHLTISEGGFTAATSEGVVVQAPQLDKAA